MRNQNKYTQINMKSVERNNDKKVGENMNRIACENFGNCCDTSNCSCKGEHEGCGCCGSCADHGEHNRCDGCNGGRCCGGYTAHGEHDRSDCGGCNCKDHLPFSRQEDALDAYAKQLQEAIPAILKNIISLMICEVSEELEPEDTVVLLLSEDGDDAVLGRAECEAAYDGVYRFRNEELEDDFGLFVAFDGDHLVQIGEDAWLIDAPLMVFEIDEYGNEGDITADTILHARKFLKERRKELVLDGKTYSAFRLSI